MSDEDVAFLDLAKQAALGDEAASAQLGEMTLTTPQEELVGTFQFMAMMGDEAVEVIDQLVAAASTIIG